MAIPHPSVPVGSIVVGVDGSESGARALDWAITQALLEHRPLTLAHGLAPAAMAGAGEVGIDRQVFVNALQVGGAAILEAARQHVAARAPDLEIHDVLRVSDPREVLLALSGEASMVVLGSRGCGSVRSLLLGSVGVAVTKHARCPVVVLRPAQAGAVRNGVLVGADGTQGSQAVLGFAFRIASARYLPLTVLHCYQTAVASVGIPHDLGVEAQLEEQRLLVAESVAGMAEEFPEVRVRTELTHGSADDCLVRAGLRMDLVVVGAHEGGALSRLTRGSVASSVVEHARCTVAVVPASA